MHERDAVLVLSEAPDSIAVELPGGGRTVVLDPSRPLAIRLAGRPRTDPYEIRVCTFDPTGRPDAARLSTLHRLGWSGRTRCHVLFVASKGWLVRDSGSTVAVQVNGRRVGEHSLADGDRIEAALGLTFTFEKPMREPSSRE